MKKQTVYKDIVESQITGDVYELNTIVKPVGGKNFWKMYLMDFLSALGVIDSKQLDVLIYILEHTNKTNNLFIGTYKKISQETSKNGKKTSSATISTIMKKLQEVGFIRKVQNGVWFIEPKYLFVGSDNKAAIMIKYVDEATCVDDIPELYMDGEVKNSKE